MAKTLSLSGNTSKRTPSPLSLTSTGYVHFLPQAIEGRLIVTYIQNFSKFLVKDGKITWFPARSTKVVSTIPPILAPHGS